MTASRTRPIRGRASTRSAAAFTLAEVLAALAFMAIVIPVAVEGLRVANQAGQLALRKSVAMRIADRVINETLAASSSALGQPRGVIREGATDYEWNLRTETWPRDSMRLVTVEVVYDVQGEEYDVRLSTLTDFSTL